jgi:RNA:NAD 2'-phosphotransferase (TPT1/KptA family)
LLDIIIQTLYVNSLHLSINLSGSAHCIVNVGRRASLAAVLLANDCWPLLAWGMYIRESHANVYLLHCVPLLGCRLHGELDCLTLSRRVALSQVVSVIC